MQILVFKTNIANSNRVTDIGSALSIHPNIIGWNLDLDDSDNILRIVSNNIAAAEVESLVLNAGYFCEELQ